MDKNGTYQIVKDFINSHASEEKARFDEGLINTSYEIKGVKTGDINDFAKELAKQDVDFSNMPLSCHEEIMLAGMLIGYSRKKANEKVNDIEKLLPYIDNWATCDMLIPRLK